MFPLYAAEQLKTNNLTLGDVGIYYRNKQNNYVHCEDFPRPWQTSSISSNNIVAHLNDDFFDTINIKVFSNNNPKGTLLDTGNLRFADLHDRRLLLYHQIVPGTTPPQYNMILSLEAYDSTFGSSDLSTTNTFTQGIHPDRGDLRAPQKISTTLQTAATQNDLNDDDISYQISCFHHKQAEQANRDYAAQFPSLVEIDSIEDSRPLRKGDMAALSLNYGRVTKEMKNFELKKYIDYQRRIEADPNTPTDPELATGQILQLMGKTYYYHVSQSQQQLEDLTKVHTISFRAHGLTKLSPEHGLYGPITTTNNGILDFNLYYPKVDMSFQKAVTLGNQTVHLESGANAQQGLLSLSLLTAEGSAQEHHIINEFFNQKNAASTVKLLDIAQGWTSDTEKEEYRGEENIMILRADNYLNEEARSLGAYSKITDRLDGFIAMWTKIKTFFNNNKNDPFATVFMTPKPLTVPGQGGLPYTGMGAFAISLSNSAAWITDRMSIENGGYGGSLNIPIYSNNPYAINNVLLPTAGGGFSFNQDPFQSALEKSINANNKYTPSVTSSQNFDIIGQRLAAGNHAFTPDVISSIGSWNYTVSNVLGDPHYSPLLPDTGNKIASLWTDQINSGNIGNTTYYAQNKETEQKGTWKFVFDPVSVVSGEFYINTLDIKLSGPMPLELRRTYGSQNQANNNFGHGWKLGYFPYLMLSSDSETNPSLIYAAETDGSVIAYRYQLETKMWIPTPADNPDLVNNNDASKLSSANPFKNCIVKNVTADGTSYTLTDSDQSTRYFTVRSFPVLGSKDITRTRPYLERWKDANGNYYNFSFGTNNIADDFGELNAITSSNGTSLHFRYDSYGHITDVFSNDGRHLKYDYDAYGDLTQVILPDASVIKYAYQHAETVASSTAANQTKAPGTPYSTHLIVKEIKPNGRILENSYDDKRRVITQATTVGKSPSPSINATFTYTITSTNADGSLNGTTAVKDINGNTITYNFGNNQITGIVYPSQNKGTGVGPTASQTWETTTSTRQLASNIDRRGAQTQYGYDTQGNLISKSVSGNLSGSHSNETATTTFTYDNKNRLLTKTDPVGINLSYNYDSAHPALPHSITKTASGKTIETTTRTYADSGEGKQKACGLLSSESITGQSLISSTDYQYDSHGFLSQITRHTGTDDPDVVIKYESNTRGEIISETDPSGGSKKYEYDALGRPTVTKTLDKTGVLIDWHYQYYNGNGEVTWEQGARFNPTEKTYTAYDLAGHPTEKTSWLSAALPDGSGVVSGGTATAFFDYDGYGNLTKIIDPNGHCSTMEYNALGEMIKRISGDGMAMESFTYEPGGQVATHTTALGDTESNNYTSTGLLQSTTHADGTTTSYLYDLSSRLIQETLPNSSFWKIVYNNTDGSITRTFCNGSGSILSTESKTIDSRGNTLSLSDATGNIWTSIYDGLGRCIQTIGPASTTISSQQKTWISYDPARHSITAINALGERNTTFLDTLDRPIWNGRENADSGFASIVSYCYSRDHQSVTTTTGTGSNAIKMTTYTDPSGLPLIFKYGEEKGAQCSSYDACGNRISFTDELGNVTQWTYDALNHLASETLPGGAVTTYSYNAAGELLTRSMPQGLIEKNEYNQEGQKISDALIGIYGEITRNHTYSYTAGLVSSISDPRGFTTSISYDSWQHPMSVVSSGAAVSEQNQTTTYAYDPRGLLASVAQCYNDASTGPSTVVSRAYDAYGQLTSETTSLNGTNVSAWTQSWNGAGERTALNWTLDNQGKGAQYSFTYNALGLRTSSANVTGMCSYAYGDQGLLNSRKTPFGSMTLQRDYRGNITSETLQEGTQESLSWRADGRLSSYSIVGLANETRNYDYDVRGRLTQEPFLSLSQGTQTADYKFDQNPLGTGASALNGLGVRTSQLAADQGGNQVAGINGFAQVYQVANIGSNGATNLSNFSYDSEGEVYDHYFVDEHYNKVLTWDSFGRLVNVAQRDACSRGYDWRTVYDGLGRRLQTSYYDVDNNQQAAVPLHLGYYYDPEVEFLELGQDYFGRTWNLYGPDRSGTYGSATIRL